MIVIGLVSAYNLIVNSAKADRNGKLRETAEGGRKNLRELK